MVNLVGRERWVTMSLEDCRVAGDEEGYLTVMRRNMANRPSFGNSASKQGCSDDYAVHDGIIITGCVLCSQQISVYSWSSRKRLVYNYRLIFR